MPRIRQHIDRHGDTRRRVIKPYEPDVHGLGIFVEAIEDPNHQRGTGLVERLSNLNRYSR